MDGSGNAGMTYKHTVAEDDFSTYSVSAATDAAITNQFNDADLNLYEHTADQKVTYLSRNDWAGTYPEEAVKLTCVDSGMVADMQYATPPEDDGSAKMPTYGANNGLSLIDMMYEDYDSEEWDKLLDQMTLKEQAEIILLGSRQLAGVSSVTCLLYTSPSPRDRG